MPRACISLIQLPPAFEEVIRGERGGFDVIVGNPPWEKPRVEEHAFWARHVPGLKPTAGYPGDAARYLEAIRPAAQRLGITEAALWRCR